MLVALRPTYEIWNLSLATAAGELDFDGLANGRTYLGLMGAVCFDLDGRLAPRKARA